MPLPSSAKDSRPINMKRSAPSFLAMLAARDLAKIRAGREEKTEKQVTTWVPHQPSLKQRKFLSLQDEEVMFGGAAGGGKSDALLMAALQYVDVPGYAAILFRRTFSDLALPGAIMDRAALWLGPTAAKWNAGTKTWRFPSGATLTFGYLQHENHKLRYKSSAFQFVGFDELTQFTETQYLYLFSRLRRLKGANIPLRMRSATNPGDEGHEWVKARFVSPGVPGAVFVPSRMTDNPGLDVEEYKKSLAKLDDVTRQQLEEGDWDILPGGTFFQHDWFKYVEPGDPVMKGVFWVRYWDLAATVPKPGKKADWTAGAKVGIKRLKDQSFVMFVDDVHRFQKKPGDTEKLIKSVAKSDGKGVRIYIEEEGGSSGKYVTHNYASKVLFGWSVHGHRKTGSKATMWQPVSSAAQHGCLYLVRGTWNAPFTRELVALPGVNDDQADAVAGGLDRLTNDAAGMRIAAMVAGQ